MKEEIKGIFVYGVSWPDGLHESKESEIKRLTDIDELHGGVES